MTEISTQSEFSRGWPNSIPVTYSLLINLVSALGECCTKDLVHAHLKTMFTADDLSFEQYLEIDELITCALNWCRDFVWPTKVKRKPTANEARALRELDRQLAGLNRTG